MIAQLLESALDAHLAKDYNTSNIYYLLAAEQGPSISGSAACVCVLHPNALSERIRAGWTGTPAGLEVAQSNYAIQLDRGMILKRSEHFHPRPDLINILRPPPPPFPRVLNPCFLQALSRRTRRPRQMSARWWRGAVRPRRAAPRPRSWWATTTTMGAAPKRTRRSLHSTTSWPRTSTRPRPPSISATCTSTARAWTRYGADAVLGVGRRPGWGAAHSSPVSTAAASRNH